MAYPKIEDSWEHQECISRWKSRSARCPIPMARVISEASTSRSQLFQSPRSNRENELQFAVNTASTSVSRAFAVDFSEVTKTPLMTLLFQAICVKIRSAVCCAKKQGCHEGNPDSVPAMVFKCGCGLHSLLLPPLSSDQQVNSIAVETCYSKLPADSMIILASPSDWRNTFPH